MSFTTTYDTAPKNIDPKGLNPGLGETIPGMLDAANNGKKAQQDTEQQSEKQRY